VEREVGHCERRQQDIVEQMEEIQDEARGRHEEEFKQKRVFQYLFHMFHFCDEAIAGGAHASFVATCEDQ
jgi:hypothetical protein